MATAIMLGLMLVFEPVEENIMQRKPRDPKQPLFTKSMVWEMLVVGFYLLSASYGMFAYSLSVGYSEEYARTVAVNIFVFIELFYLFSCKELHKSLFKVNIFNNKFLLFGVFLMTISQIAFTHTSFMNTMFKSESLDILSWISILILSFCVIFIIVLKRYFERKREINN